MNSKAHRRVLARNFRKMLRVDWNTSHKMARVYSKNESIVDFLNYLEKNDMFKVEKHYDTTQVGGYTEEILSLSSIITNRNNTFFCTLKELLEGKQDEKFSKNRIYKVYEYGGCYEDEYEKDKLYTFSLEKAVTKKDELEKENRKYDKQARICEQCCISYFNPYNAGNIPKKETEEYKCKFYKKCEDSYLCCNIKYNTNVSVYEASLTIQCIKVED